jgi:sterol desaturase/sphingolipid hydroxylase (fatty acid hydroxylase superfamily)
LDVESRFPQAQFAVLPEQFLESFLYLAHLVLLLAQKVQQTGLAALFALVLPVGCHSSVELKQEEPRRLHQAVVDSPSVVYQTL